MGKEGRWVSYVFELSGVRALNIAQRWVILDDARGHQVVQSQKILFLAKPVEVPTAEWQGAKVLGNHVQEVLRRRKSQRDVGSARDLRIVGRFHLDPC